MIKISSLGNLFRMIKLESVIVMYATFSIPYIIVYYYSFYKNKNIVAKSTPTFASDNMIIVNEVKIQLISNKLVVTPYASLDASQMTTIDEAINYLYGNDINTDSIDLDNFDNNLDSGINENENDGLGLNAFVNKLQGGKKLRENMKKMMKKNSDQLKSDLASTK